MAKPENSKPSSNLPPYSQSSAKVHPSSDPEVDPTSCSLEKFRLYETRQENSILTREGNMARNRVGVICLLLLCGAILLSFNPGSEGKVCPEICYDAAYMTCPSSGNEQLTPVCNCCLAAQGCTLYDADGNAICTAT